MKPERSVRIGHNAGIARTQADYVEPRANSEKIPTKQAFNKHDGMKRHFKHNGSTKP